jgi:hypothetical protein
MLSVGLEARLPQDSSAWPPAQMVSGLARSRKCCDRQCHFILLEKWRNGGVPRFCFSGRTKDLWRVLPLFFEKMTCYGQPMEYNSGHMFPCISYVNAYQMYHEIMLCMYMSYVQYTDLVVLWTVQVLEKHIVHGRKKKEWELGTAGSGDSWMCGPTVTVLQLINNGHSKKNTHQ